MKKLVSALLAVAMLLSITAVAFGDTYIVLTETDPLLVRDAPYGGDPIGQYPKFTLVEGEKHDNYKIKVNFKGKVGYMYSGLMMKYEEYLQMKYGSEWVKYWDEYCEGEEYGCECQEPGFDPLGSTTTPSKYVKIYSSMDINSFWVVNPEKVQKGITVFAKNDTNSEVRGHLTLEDVIKVISVGPKYTKILYGGYVCYVLTKNIMFFENYLPDDGQLAQIKLQSDTTVRLWSKKSQDSTVIIRLFNNMYVKVLSDDGEWAKVMYNHGGDTAYILSRYLILGD